MRINKSAVAVSHPSRGRVRGRRYGVHPGKLSVREDRPGLRLNQIQLIGAHNSYHRELSAAEKQVQQAQDPGSINLCYSHAPIPQQLQDQNVRALELDLFPDPAGGLTLPADPETDRPGATDRPGDGQARDQGYARAGLRLQHHLRHFVVCLKQVKSWSDQHPDHAPITIQLELKQSDRRWSRPAE